MSPPHALRALGNGSEEGELGEVDDVGRSSTADDFDSVFGETSPAVQRSSPRKSKDPIKMTREEANDLIKDILSRKPPTISPTLPRLQRSSGELKEMGADPLDCGDGNDYTRTSTLSVSSGSHLLEEALDKRPKAKSATATPRSAANRTMLGRSSMPQEVLRAAITNTTTRIPPNTFKTGGPASGKLKDYISMVGDIRKKEQFTDTIEDWKNVIRSLEKTETIELAKSPRDSTLLASLALLASWVAEHLVDLIVKRIQTKCIVSAADPPALLSLATQISVLRETARQCYLRGHHHLSASRTSTSHDANCLSNYQSLDQLIGSLCKL